MVAIKVAERGLILQVRAVSLMKAVLTQPSRSRFTRERKSGPVVKVVADEITIA